MGCDIGDSEADAAGRKTLVRSPARRVLIVQSLLDQPRIDSPVYVDKLPFKNKLSRGES